MRNVGLVIALGWMAFGTGTCWAATAAGKTAQKQKEQPSGPPSVSLIPPAEDTVMPLNVYHGRHLFLQAGGRSAINFRYLLGFEGMVGWQFRYLGLDFKANYTSARYGGLYVELDPGSSPENYQAANDRSSELNRPRSFADQWNYLLLQPGISVMGHIFPGAFPNLAQKARFGFGFGTFTDQVNSVAFSSQIWSFEAMLQYQFTQTGRFGLEFGGGWNVGRLISKTNPTELGRIPVSYVTMNLGVFVWLF